MIEGFRYAAKVLRQYKARDLIEDVVGLLVLAGFMVTILYLVPLLQTPLTLHILSHTK